MSTQKDSLSGNDFYGQGYSDYQTIIPALIFSTPKFFYVENWSIDQLEVG
jgi:hypothetical protein